MADPIHLQTSIDVDAPVQQVWDALVDWQSQGEWMIATKVTGTADGVGGKLAAFSGLGPIGFLDTMEVTVWEPPHRCDVDHRGAVVRGTGTFLIDELDAGRARLTWIEDLSIPGGAVGRFLFATTQSVFMALVDASLKRFKVFVEAR